MRPETHRHAQSSLHVPQRVKCLRELRNLLWKKPIFLRDTACPRIRRETPGSYRMLDGVRNASRRLIWAEKSGLLPRFGFRLQRRRLARRLAHRRRECPGRISNRWDRDQIDRVPGTNENYYRRGRRKGGKYSRSASFHDEHVSSRRLLGPASIRRLESDRRPVRASPATDETSECGQTSLMNCRNVRNSWPDVRPLRNHLLQH